MAAGLRKGGEFDRSLFVKGARESVITRVKKRRI
jgi:hypothetical protein